MLLSSVITLCAFATNIYLMLAFFGIAYAQPRVRRREHLVAAGRRRADARSRRIDRRHPELRVEPGGHRHHDLHRLHARDHQGLVHDSAVRRGRLLLSRRVQLSCNRRQDRTAQSRRRRARRRLDGRALPHRSRTKSCPPPSTDHAVIRLHPNDDVVIATRQLMSGARIASEDLVVDRADSAGPQDRDARHRRRASRSSATTRSSAWRARRSRAASTCTCTISSMAEFAREHEFGVDQHPTPFVEQARDFHGHPPRRRPRRDAQFHRRADERELLGDGRARHRRSFPPRRASGSARGLSERGWRDRADARPRMRHRHAGRRPRDSAPHACRLRGASELSFGAVRRAGLRDEPDFRRARIERPEGRRASCAASRFRTAAARGRRSSAASRW